MQSKRADEINIKIERISEDLNKRLEILDTEVKLLEIKASKKKLLAEFCSSISQEVFEDIHGFEDRTAG